MGHITGLKILLPLIWCIMCASNTSGIVFDGLAKDKIRGLVCLWLRNILSGENFEYFVHVGSCSTENLDRKHVYNISTTEVKALTEFIEETLTIEQRKQAYIALVTEMISNGLEHTHEMLYLIYRIRVRHNTFILGKSYADLLAKIPENMRAIVFGECVFVKSRDLNELLYETSKYYKIDFASSRPVLHTWKEGVDDDKGAEWSFEPHEEQGRLYFFIKHYYKKSYRYWALAGKLNSIYGNLVAVYPKENIPWFYPDDTHLRWIVDPVPGGNFVIRSWNGLYVYAVKNWCRDSWWDCFWNKRSYYHIKPYVLADKVSSWRKMKIYPNGRSCELNE